MQSNILVEQLHLSGHWQKVSTSLCGQFYPDSIEFRGNGLYFTQNEPPGRFTQWDVGTYEVAGPQQVKISTANDAIVTYSAIIKSDRLIFIAPDGCEFSYRRIT